jgi:hypothetical protein
MALNNGMHSRGQRLDDADFSGTRLHSPNLTASDRLRLLGTHSQRCDKIV